MLQHFLQDFLHHGEITPLNVFFLVTYIQKLLFLQMYMLCWKTCFYNKL